ncbi:MAG: branched-chain amino acid transaminase [Acidobacteriota bacterium]
MSFTNAKYIWRNGQILPWQSATIHISAHGLHYGTGVFEGIRCYNTDRGPAIFRLEAHIERLFASARLHHFTIPYTPEYLCQAVVDTVRANELTSSYIRPIVFLGSGSLGLLPTNCPTEVAIMAWEWGLLLGNESAERGVRATISSWRKFESHALPASAKACGQYINSVLASREAHARGFDEALLLNSAGNIAEASGENLFIVKDHTLITNGMSDDVLMGVTRDTIIRLASELGYTVVVRAISKTDLFTADEAFVTGTAAEIVALSEVDGRVIGSTANLNRPVLRSLQQAFRRVVTAQDEKHLDWLKFINSVAATRADHAA